MDDALGNMTAVAATTPARRVRLGFAGVGWIGRHRLQAIAQSGLADVVAVADPAAGASEAAASAVGGEVSVTQRFEDLLQMDLDGVVIATPSALHAEQSIAALERGLAVFCQKPLGRNARETRAVVDAARAADRLLQVDLSYRFTQGMQRIHELLRAGQLGRVFAVEAVFHNAYGPDKTWFYDVRQSGGGCLLDLGIHLVDLGLWALDYPNVEEVAGQVVSRAGGMVEDYAAGLLRLGNGATFQLSCSWKLPAGCDARIEIAFYGTEGGAALRNRDGSFFDFVAERLGPDRSRISLSEPPDAWGGRAAVEWTRQLGLSSRFDPEVDHLVEVAAVLDRIYARA